MTKRKKISRRGRVRGTVSVPCGKCRGPTRVLKTRRRDGVVTRRRRCLSVRCRHEFMTEEKKA